MVKIINMLLSVILCGGIAMSTECVTNAAENATAENTKIVRMDGVKYAALTFDDGPNSTTTPKVLDALEKYGIKASFFVVGDNISDSSSAVVKRAFDMGCEINNHSKTHSDMTKMPAEEIKAEIKFTSDKVEEITGEPTRFFRPPYIAVNQTMLDSVDLPFICGYGANDWDDSVSADQRAEKILAQAKDGCIILLHDMTGNSKTVEALDRIIPEMQKDGYEFVTVTQLFDVCDVEIRSDTDIVYSYAQQTK